ncbi:MAG: 5'-3' exonuclease H3TH domain-containing protein [Ruminococcus callidus]
MKLLAIDGNSILNRAFYGIRPLSNTQGVFTHAIFGFMNIYLKNRDEVQPDAVVVAFDLRKPTFRHKAVATYKANRKGMPEELAMQLPYVKQLLTLLGIPVITCEGYEADDILGTLAAACTAQDADCVILTGDRDSLQLVSDHVTVRLTTNKETIPYTPERFQEEYGFAPLSLIDLKALMGDSSDNISGVAGVGQKTASKLIQAWGTVENLYAHLDEAGLTKSVYNKLCRTGRGKEEQVAGNDRDRCADRHGRSTICPSRCRPRSPQAAAGTGNGKTAGKAEAFRNRYSRSRSGRAGRTAAASDGTALDSGSAGHMVC